MHRLLECGVVKESEIEGVDDIQGMNNTVVVEFNFGEEVGGIDLMTAVSKAEGEREGEVVGKGTQTRRVVRRPQAPIMVKHCGEDELL